MLYELILILISLGILIISADQLVSQADIIARRFNFSQVLVGLTVVAFGTSAPELMVSISAALFETPPASDAIIGNVIGSNIANLFLVLGVSGILFNISFNNIDQKTNFYLFVVTTFLIIILSTSTNINWIHSFILLLILILFINHLKNFSSNVEISELKQASDINFIKLTLSFIRIISIFYKHRYCTYCNWFNNFSSRYFPSRTNNCDYCCDEKKSCNGYWKYYW